MNQPYQYNYGVPNQNHCQSNNYPGHNVSHGSGGYQFSQYHMNNNYAPTYSHHDEQLL